MRKGIIEHEICKGVQSAVPISAPTGKKIKNLGKSLPFPGMFPQVYPTQVPVCRNQCSEVGVTTTGFRMVQACPAITKTLPKQDHDTSTKTKRQCYMAYPGSARLPMTSQHGPTTNQVPLRELHRAKSRSMRKRDDLPHEHR